MEEITESSQFCFVTISLNFVYCIPELIRHACDCIFFCRLDSCVSAINHHYKYHPLLCLLEELICPARKPDKQGRAVYLFSILLFNSLAIESATHTLSHH